MFLFFFFKQKTAYELRISDWSSDVCSSDLSALAVLAMTAASAQDRTTAPALSAAPDPAAFREPPADTRPNTLYFWMNGNVTREGIDADLTAMRDIGLDRKSTRLNSSH